MSCGALVALLGLFSSTLTAAGGSGRAAVISATPAVGLADQARTIVVSHLPPGATITVTARTPRLGGIWSASATFKANGGGVVDLARDAPLSGSYRGVSAMGCSGPSAGPARGLPPRPRGP